MRQLVSCVWGNKYDDMDRNFTYIMVLDVADVDYDEIIELFAFFDYKELTGHQYLMEINPMNYKEDIDNGSINKEGFAFFDTKDPLFESKDSLFDTKSTNFNIEDSYTNKGSGDKEDKL